MKAKKGCIVFVSTFPPRQCGIATYTADLTRALKETYGEHLEARIVAINRHEIIYRHYPREVILKIEQDWEQDYQAVAEELNKMDHVQVVHIQHEFGIFGGSYGSYLLGLTDALKKPMVVTFHTVLPKPATEMRNVVERLCKRMTRIIVMTNTAKQILEEEYGIAGEKIDVIPHGIPSTLFQSSTRAKAQLGFTGKTTLMTFGLLSRGKGIEYVIDALPEVVKKHPDTLYLLVGATHPVVMEKEGLSYYNELIQRIYDLGLTKHVRIHHKYLSSEELQSFLQATDIYICTPLDPNQSVSGTLSYAAGTGKAIVSTGFAQAKELVTQENGVIVGFRDSNAYTQALLDLLDNPKKRAQMSQASYQKTRSMTWENVALLTNHTYSLCSNELKSIEIKLPPLKLTHLERLTTPFGMIQFADLSTPDPSSGYTVDDNARALLFSVRLYERQRKPFILNLIKRYLDFLEHASHKDGTFANYVHIDKRHHTERNQSENLEDANARAFQALAVTASSTALSKHYRDQAQEILRPYLDKISTLSFLRSKAFTLLGLHALYREAPTETLKQHISQIADYMVAEYQQHHADHWEWFEPCLTYANSVLPEALWLAYQVTKNEAYRKIGTATLEFLLSQTMADGVYIPIGQNGWCQKDGSRALYDQQPEDPSYLIQSLTTIQRIHPNSRYEEAKKIAFAWFLGKNTLHQTVYNRLNGGCYDGISEQSVNLNQGAESTLAYLLARLAIEQESTE